MKDSDDDDRATTAAAVEVRAGTADLPSTEETYGTSRTVARAVGPEEGGGGGGGALPLSSFSFPRLRGEVRGTREEPRVTESEAVAAAATPVDAVPCIFASGASLFSTSPSIDCRAFHRANEEEIAAAEEEEGLLVSEFTERGEYRGATSSSSVVRIPPVLLVGSIVLLPTYVTWCWRYGFGVHTHTHTHSSKALLLLQSNR